MVNEPRITFLMKEARLEVYQLINKHYKSMPKKADGSIDEYARGLANNDIDALSHSFVSGVYTMEYGETTADMLGRLNEIRHFNFGEKVDPSENMDLWNNAVGRKYGKKVKSRKELFELLLKALKDGEVIIEPKDTRKYKGEKSIRRVPNDFVIKIKETKTGANVEFLDIHKKVIMIKEEFILAIKNDDYPNYSIKRVNDEEIPISKRDRFKFDNLG